MPWPSRTTRGRPPSVRSEAVPLLLLLELGIRLCVAGDAVGVGEEIVVAGLLRVQAAIDAGQARVRDRPRRQPRMEKGVERRVLLLVLVGERTLELAQAVE